MRKIKRRRMFWIVKQGRRMIDRISKSTGPMKVSIAFLIAMDDYNKELLKRLRRK